MNYTFKSINPRSINAIRATHLAYHIVDNQRLPITLERLGNLMIIVEYNHYKKNEELLTNGVYYLFDDRYFEAQAIDAIYQACHKDGEGNLEFYDRLKVSRNADAIEEVRIKVNIDYPQFESVFSEAEIESIEDICDEYKSEHSRVYKDQLEFLIDASPNYPGITNLLDIIIKHVPLRNKNFWYKQAYLRMRNDITSVSNK